MTQEQFEAKLREKYQEFDKQHFVDMTRRLYPHLVDDAVSGDKDSIIEIINRIRDDATMYTPVNEENFELWFTLCLMDTYWNDELDN